MFRITYYSNKFRNSYFKTVFGDTQEDIEPQVRRFCRKHYAPVKREMVRDLR